MGSILIAMPKSDDASRIEGIIRSRGLMIDTEVCQTGSEILRTANDRDFGVVICTKRLKDMGYLELSEYLPSCFSIIVLTSDSSLETVSDRMVKLLLPFKSGELIATVEMLTAGFIRHRKKKPNGPRVRTEEEKLVIDNAKQILMDRNGMSEPEAFRYIQKTSMDTGRTTVESAQMIILMNEA